MVESGVNEIVIRKAGHEIRSLEDWLKAAPPPEAEKEWQEGRGIRELAGAFFPPGGGVQVPADLGGLLESATGPGPLRVQSVIPEYLVRLDGKPGGSQRCHALAVAQGRDGRAAVVIQARTDEGFGPLVADQLKRGKPGSQWARRMERLSQELLGRALAECGGLRSGLLLQAAAAIRAAEGEKAGMAVLVWCEFRPKRSRAQQLKQQSDDLDAFVRMAGGGALKPGALAGPFRVPGGEELPATIPLYVGKVVTLL